MGNIAVVSFKKRSSLTILMIITHCSVEAILETYDYTSRIANLKYLPSLMKQ